MTRCIGQVGCVDWLGVFSLELLSKADLNSELEFSDYMNNINYNIHNQDELFGTDHKDFLVGNLADKLHYLFVKLIAAVSDSNCTFNSMFCNLLID